MNDDEFVEELTYRLQEEFGVSEGQAQRVAERADRARSDTRFGSGNTGETNHAVARNLADAETAVQYLSGTGPTDLEHMWNQRVGEWRHQYRVPVADLRLE